jgi:hypothetical protein
VGENGNPWYGERNKKRPLKIIKRALTNALLWACQM